MDATQKFSFHRTLNSLSKGSPEKNNRLSILVAFLLFNLTRTSRNQKGKVAQGVACQRQEKRDKREAHPFGDFPWCIF